MGDAWGTAGVRVQSVQCFIFLAVGSVEPCFSHSLLSANLSWPVLMVVSVLHVQLRNITIACVFVRHGAHNGRSGGLEVWAMLPDGSEVMLRAVC